jgi:hypothetical protein
MWPSMVEPFRNTCCFFGISNNHLSLSKQFDAILDCPSGPSSFVAEANKRGLNVVGCDPLFGYSLKRLRKRGKDDIKKVIEKVKVSPNLYRWGFYNSVQDLMEYRTLALRGFVSDYCEGLVEKRYIKGSLPRLPFNDKSYDLVLSGHFLFTYAEKFDFNFHLSSILELFRVSRKEVRVYPIQQGMVSQPYQQIEELLAALRKHDIKHEITTVPFEFQKGSNKMLRLLR